MSNWNQKNPAKHWTPKKKDQQKENKKVNKRGKKDE